MSSDGGAASQGEVTPERPVLFIHIPRTGGSSLKQMSREAFGWSRCLSDLHLYDFQDPERAPDLGDYEFAEGHVHAQFFKRMAPAGCWPANVMTVLREPVSRAMSQAVHTRVRPSHVRGDAWKEHLRDEIDDPDALFDRMPLLVDTQTKTLGNRHPQLREVDEAALADAKATLDQILFGLTEEFSAGIALMADRFNIHFPNVIKSNASPTSGNDDLRSDAFREAVRRNNVFDLQLYAYARELFRRRADAFCEQLLDGATAEAPAELSLRTPAVADDGSIVVESATRPLVLDGAILVDGRAADAAFARVGDTMTPLVRGLKSFRLAEGTRNARHRFAGINGAVRIPEGVTELEICAFDRGRKLQASARLKLVSAAAARITAARHADARHADPSGAEPARERITADIESDEDAVTGGLPMPPEPEIQTSGSDQNGARGQRQLELLERFGLDSSDRILEIGCGIGRLAYALTSFLGSSGSYAGVDIQSEPIDWLNEHYAPQLPNFRFDVVRRLTPRPPAKRGLRPGKAPAPGPGRLPFDDDSFDVVCAFAVFTRMSLEEIRLQLRESVRVVRAGGYGVFTINAVTAEDERPVNVNGRAFFPLEEGVYTAFPDNPRKHVLALDEALIETILRQEGWTQVQRIEGAWHRKARAAGGHGPERATPMPFHGSDVFVVTPTVQKIGRTPS